MVRRGESSPGAGIQSAIEVPVDIDRLADNILGINVIPFPYRNGVRADFPEVEPDIQRSLSSDSESFASLGMTPRITFLTFYGRMIYRIYDIYFGGRS